MSWGLVEHSLYIWVMTVLQPRLVDLWGLRKVLRFVDLIWPTPLWTHFSWKLQKSCFSLHLLGVCPNSETLQKLQAASWFLSSTPCCPKICLAESVIYLFMIHLDSKKRKENLEKFTWYFQDLTVVSNVCKREKAAEVGLEECDNLREERCN